MTSVVFVLFVSVIPPQMYHAAVEKGTRHKGMYAHCPWCKAIQA